MNRQPVVAVWIVALVATASLVTHAQALRFAPLTDETLRSPAPADWPAWRRDRAGTGYSPLDHINRSNVRRLHLAWASTLEAGSLEPEPLVFNGVRHSTRATARCCGSTGASARGTHAAADSG